MPDPSPPGPSTPDPRTIAAITITGQHNGPPGSGNGGYSAGMAAQFIPGAADVSLRAPPPLDTPLDVAPTDAGVDILHEGALIMSAKPAGALAQPPSPPDASLAALGPDQFLEGHTHPFPACFVCGPERHAGDGLCIFAGPVPGSDGVAALWTPHQAFANDTGLIPAEILWAALDCPSAFALRLEGAPALLARMSARILTYPPAGAPLIVSGWKRDQEGRKHHAGAALHTIDGVLVAHSETLWITPRSS